MGRILLFLMLWPVLLAANCRPVAGQTSTKLECRSDQEDICIDLSLEAATRLQQESKVAFEKECKPKEGLSRCLPTFEIFPTCKPYDAYWSSIDSLNVRREFQTMLRRAASGEVFKDAGPHDDVHYKKIVEVMRQDGNERHFALCNVVVVNGKEGPPSDCQTTAIVTSDRTLIRSTVPRELCNASAVVGLDGATIDIRFDVLTELEETPFVSSLAKLLKNVLELDFKQQSFNDKDGKPIAVSFFAVAPIRDSKILSGGLRESFDFSLSLVRQPRGFALRGRTKPMICRTASGNVTEYHGLNDVQKSTYASVLNNDLSSAIASACAAFVVVDNDTLSCK